MKHKITVLILCMFLCGCSTTNDVQKSEVDSNQWGYQFTHAQLASPFNAFTRSTWVKDILYLRVPVITYLQGNRSNEGVLLSTYNLQTKEYKELNNNPSKVCSSTNPKNCSGYIEKHISELSYYDNRLFYSMDTINNKEQRVFELYQMNLDGTNRKRVLTIDDIKDTVIYSFHNGFMYCVDDNNIKKINVNSWKQEIILEQDNITFHNLQFDQEFLYVNAWNYTDTSGEIYPKVVLEVDISKKAINPIYTYIEDVMYVNKEYIVEYRTDGLYSINRTNKQEKLLSTNIGYVFTSEQLVLLSETGENSSYVLCDLEGNIYDEIEKGDLGGFGELLTNNAFYTLQYEREDSGAISKQTFVKYPIIDKKFQNPIILFSIDV